MTHVTRLAIATAVLFTIAGSGAAVAQATKKAAAGKEQLWQVEFVMGGSGRYTGTMTLKTAKGAVTGTMLLDVPTRIEGQVEGRQKGNLLQLDYPFTMIEDNCTGRVQIEATIAPKGQEASGTARATGCGEPVEGTFAMKKPARS